MSNIYNKIAWHRVLLLFIPDVAALVFVGLGVGLGVGVGDRLLLLLVADAAVLAFLLAVIAGGEAGPQL